MSIGRHVSIHTTKVLDPDMITLEDDVNVGEDAVLEPHGFLREGISLQQIVMGAGSKIGARAVVSPWPTQALHVPEGTSIPAHFAPRISKLQPFDGFGERRQPNSPSFLWQLLGIASGLSVLLSGYLRFSSLRSDLRESS